MHEPGPASIHETGPIPAVGIPAKYHQICNWGDTPIYSCQHCRDNGTFRPERFNYLSAEELKVQLPATEAPDPRHPSPRISGPFLRDFEVRRILEGWGIPRDGRGYDPVNEAFSRGHLGKGRPGVENGR